MFVVYFNQHLGDAHSKCWSKYALQCFFVKKVLDQCLGANCKPNEKVVCLILPYFPFFLFIFERFSYEKT